MGRYAVGVAGMCGGRERILAKEKKDEKEYAETLKLTRRNKYTAISFKPNQQPRVSPRA